MVRRFRSSFLLLLVAIAFAAPTANAANVGYDIVYVRAPRYGDTTFAKWPEVFHPTHAEPGSDLMLLHPDGREEVLYSAGNGAVMDPTVSFDAKWVYFSYQPDVRPSALNTQRGSVSTGGADIYKINVQTRQTIRLTQQTWTPPSGVANWSTNHLAATSAGQTYLGYGIFNLGPCPLPGGKVMFTSSRDGYLPNKGFTFPNLRLYIMDDDGKNVEPVGHLNMGSALHPTVLKDGRVMFSSFETQGQRDSRLWGLWAIWPDGRKFEPLFSAFVAAGALHFQTQLSDSRLAVVEYYNLNNNGFGTLLAFNADKPAASAPFGSPNPNDASNPDVRRGIWYFQPGHPAHLQPRYKRYPFSPPGLVALTGFTHGEDEASGLELDGSYAGKVTHPSGAPGNDVLLVWSPGPNNNLNRPTTTPRYDGGIYLLKNGTALTTSRDLVLVKNDPNYNEQQPRPLVSYAAIYGVEEPARLPYLPNSGTEHSQLPPGTPFGLVGASSFYKRNSFPGYAGRGEFGGLDVFNTAENESNSNWFTQGADAGKYNNSDIHAVRILLMESLAHRSYTPDNARMRTHQENEKLRILGEIPLRKGGGSPDPDGNPDTSFLAKIPADTPFTFQTLDRNGMVLNMAQTWHQVRPGEVRTDCGGCHGHAQAPTEFSRTAAGQSGYTPVDLTKGAQVLAGDGSVKRLATPVLDVEYFRDIKPLLQRSCVPCHTRSGSPPKGLVMDDTAIVGGFENTYNRLAWDAAGQYGTPSVINSKTWRQTNASRYIRSYQSRRSLLVWKIFGARLDGWTNADHPTERVDGDASTLPAGADANVADIDFTGTMMPPPNSGVPALSADERLTIARWIDLGCPIAQPSPTTPNLWLVDELKPTLTVSWPRAETSAQALTKIQFGAFDATSGLNRASLSVVADFAVNGKAAGTELAPLFTESGGDNVWTLALNPPIAVLPAGNLTVKVRDVQGNESVVQRSFRIAGASIPPVAVEPAAASLGAGQTRQFTANASVVWTITPVTGTITSAGLYTAPTSIVSSSTVTVTASSTTDASNKATAVVTLQAAAPTLSPATAAAGSAAFTLTVTGGPFASNATVLWNGSARATTFADSSTLRATITAADVAAAGSFAVTVAGSASAAATFVVSPATGSHFVPLTPCRAVDTRSTTAIPRLSSRDFGFAACGVPANATAVALNVTAVPVGTLGYLSMWPSGQAQPVVSTLNSTDGRIKANAAIAPVGANGRLNVFVTDASHVILDVSGYFVPAGTPGALAFYPTAPCRALDTREAGAGGSLAKNETRTVRRTTGGCLSAAAQAYSLNVTVVPKGVLGYLSLWPDGETQPVVSTLNALTGAIVANAAIVPVGRAGAINAFVTDAADLIVDSNGYFAPAGSPGALALYPLTQPCRISDTRNAAGMFGGPRLEAAAGRAYPVVSSGCGLPVAAQAFVVNATVVPSGPMGFLTLWPEALPRPTVSTLNAVDGSLTSNLAIVGSSGGSVRAYANSATHLILDVSGYFAP